MTANIMSFQVTAYHLQIDGTLTVNQISVKNNLQEIPFVNKVYTFLSHHMQVNMCAYTHTNSSSKVQCAGYL